MLRTKIKFELKIFFFFRAFFFNKWMFLVVLCGFEFFCYCCWFWVFLCCVCGFPFLYTFADLAKSLNILTSMTFHIISEWSCGLLLLQNSIPFDVRHIFCNVLPWWLSSWNSCTWYQNLILMYCVSLEGFYTPFTEGREK